VQRLSFVVSFVAVVLCLAAPRLLAAGDWPMWRHDAGHSAAAADDLPDQLHLQWTRQYPPRRPAWDDALNRDMMSFDRVFEPVVADGRMYLSFNDADKVVALDMRNGTELWTFYCDGPVRFSPVAYRDSVLFCSDDGYLYCVAAADGGLRWRVRGGPSDRKVLGNYRVISTWPARGGPVVADDTVYFAASIWPFMGTYIYAVDARTGEVQWLNDSTSADFQKQPHSAPAFAGVAPQGQLTVAGDLLLVPGGRSLPAAFDRATGRLKFFNFGGRGEGGSFVAADRTRAFVHTRVRETMGLTLPEGKASRIVVNEPVLDGQRLYTASYTKALVVLQGAPRIDAYNRKHQRLWEIRADASGDLIKAGQRLYAAGKKTLTAVDLPEDNGAPRIAWSLPVAGHAERLVAAGRHLVAVTREGQILVFGEQSTTPRRLSSDPTPATSTGKAAQWAKHLLQTTGQTQGYAIWYGIDDPDRLEAIVTNSRLHVVAIDTDAEKVTRLRRRFDQAGLYGTRVTIHMGLPTTYLAPPYIANLVIVGGPMTDMLQDPKELQQVYRSVRPYGGLLWIRADSAQSSSVIASFSTSNLPRARIALAEGGLLVMRDGALPGSGDWTHTYGNIANTVKSDDRRVKLPLGLLWFGNNSNADVLPRHGHGPSEQVIGGRLFIEGINSLSARDVYTGRTLWARRFKDLGTYEVYYDDTYKDKPLSTEYNQVHIPGASARGANYVATTDGVYLVIGSRCLLLDSASGRTVREFELPAGPNGKSPDWGYVGVYKNLLLAGVGFTDYSGRYGYHFKARGKRGPAWGPDHSASQGLLAFDRHTGKVLWDIQARFSFPHDGIVAGGGRIYLLDKLPKRVEQSIQRRGEQLPKTYQLMAIDAEGGDVCWQHAQNIFGTWLSYSEQRGLLLQAGAAAADRSLDENDHGMAVYQGSDGALVWENLGLKYAGPCILHGDMIITNTTSYHESQGAYSLLDGKPVTITDPVTGLPLAWRFTRTYGCNTAVASENLLTFRSGAAGFYDLVRHGGTGNFGGFKSGCSSNLIVADGVLNAPDYTRTCSCGYQNQASLALIPMPANELWTYDLLGRDAGKSALIQRLGVNLGAPGDRMADDGTLWINEPPDRGASPNIEVRIEGKPTWFRHHSSRVAAGALPWVAASGAEGIAKLSVRLAPRQQTARTPAKRRFTVQAVFVEPDPDISAGQRVFDVALQGTKVLADCDIVAKTGGPFKSLVQTWHGIEARDALEIELTPKGPKPAVLCGIAIMEEKP